MIAAGRVRASGTPRKKTAAVSRALLLGLVCVCGCSNTSIGSKKEPIAGPAASLVATPNSIFKGQISNLAWDAPQASSVALNGKPVARWGSENLNPAATSSYTLHAQDASGSTDVSVRIAVSNAVPDIDFLGDSITANWGEIVDFPANGWLNGGVSGETCGDIMARFEATLSKWPPRTVHILCGTNDIWRQATDLATTKRNLSEMIEISRSSQLGVVVGTVPYIRPQGVTNPAMNAKVDSLNAWIAATAKAEGLTIADYHAALTDEDGQMNMADTDDGVHPNAAGYAVMRGVLQSALGGQK
jgi:lysophospholipase L1-like esterase